MTQPATLGGSVARAYPRGYPRAHNARAPHADA